jgi:hypothetical protein
LLETKSLLLLPAVLLAAGSKTRARCQAGLFYGLAGCGTVFFHAFAFIRHDAGRINILLWDVSSAKVRLSAVGFFSKGKCRFAADDALIAHNFPEIVGQYARTIHRPALKARFAKCQLSEATAE